HCFQLLSSCESEWPTPSRRGPPTSSTTGDDSVPPSVMSRESASPPRAEPRSLARLQKLIRQSPLTGRNTGPQVYYGVAPDNDPGSYGLTLDGTEHSLMLESVAALQGDERFEHLGRRTADHVWRFVCVVFFERRAEHVNEFVAAL